MNLFEFWLLMCLAGALSGYVLGALLTGGYALVRRLALAVRLWSARRRLLRVTRENFLLRAARDVALASRSRRAARNLKRCGS